MYMVLQSMTECIELKSSNGQSRPKRRILKTSCIFLVMTIIRTGICIFIGIRTFIGVHNFSDGLYLNYWQNFDM